MSWNEVLKDKSKFGDDLKLNVNGVEVALGDLRKVNAQTEGELARKLSEAERSITAATQREQQAAEFYAKVEKQAADLEASTKVGLTANGAYDYERDPVLGPLHKQLTAFDGELKQRDAHIKSLNDQLVQTSAYYLQEKWERDFDRVPDKGDLKLDKVLQHATDNKIVDKFGVPDVRKAADEMLRETRIAVKEKDAETRGYERAKNELAVSAVPRPDSGMGSFSPEHKQNGANDGTYSTLEQALDAAIRQASSDPDVARAFNG